MVYRLTSLRTLYLRFNRLAVVDSRIGNLKVSKVNLYLKVSKVNFCNNIKISGKSNSVPFGLLSKLIFHGVHEFRGTEIG